MHRLIDAPRIAIIGIGSRGLSVLEQLIAMARRNPRTPLRIDLFDPQSPGSGLHVPEQPDYLMLNTMAGQLSAYCAKYPAWQPGEAPGLTFLQWCTTQGLRLTERGHLSENGEGRPIEYGDFVPRKLLGRYLHDCYDYLMRLCPVHLQIRHHRDTVMACRARPDHNGFRLHTQAGQQIEADAVFMTTGHAPQAVTCSDGKHVAIDGLGLSAMDSIAALTEGRGGRYIRDGSLSGWRYRASGREPQIYLFSRSGLPFHCRPQWRPPTVAPQRLYFTAQAIGALRTSAHKSSHNAQLDFKEKVLPLIKDEMRAAFYLAQARLRSPERMEQVRQRLLGAASPEARRAAFDIMAASFGPFEPEDYLNVRGWEGNSAHYRQWFQQWVTADLARSRLGAQVCPFTQALEVWRDCRDVLRLAADHHGLTDESTLEFYGTWAALSNRLVGGPQKERYEDLLALIEAGVVRPLPPMQINSHQTGMRLTALDPACDQTIEIDGLICARNAHSGLTQNRSALIDDLLSQGLIKQAHPYPADGIDVDEHSRALRRDGAVNERLWVLGPAVEGCTFYNHYVPTPDPLCKAPLDARSAVEVCLGQLDSCVSRFALANGA